MGKPRGELNKAVGKAGSPPTARLPDVCLLRPKGILPVPGQTVGPRVFSSLPLGEESDFRVCAELLAFVFL